MRYWDGSVGTVGKAALEDTSNTLEMGWFATCTFSGEDVALSGTLLLAQHMVQQVKFDSFLPLKALELL